MEAFFIYFLKANGLLITFYLAYYFLLRKETFFNKNRWFLLSGLLISILLPLITYTKIVWITPNPIQILEPNFTETLPKIILAPVEEPLNWNLILMYVYFAVSGVLLLKIGVEIASFYKIIRLGFKEKGKKSILVNHPKVENPFSFFNYIVVNRKYFNDEELDHIITHENIHVTENHSVDVLISKLFCALFWINPMAWLYRKQMLQNLEFIADNKAVTLAENKINYQKTLLKVVSNQHQLTITNQFYQSLIKKRIVMLNTNQSNQRKSWKYAVILPVLSAFMFLFQVETVAQVKESTTKETKYTVSSSYSSILTKNTTDEELKELEKTFSNENRKLIISDVKRNKKGEIIEIKLLFDTGKTYYRVLHRKSIESIDDIRIFVKTDDKGNENCDFIETDKEQAAFMETSEKEAYSVEFESSSYVFSDIDSYNYRESIMKKVLEENIKSLLFFNDKEISKNEASKIKGNLIEEIIEISPNGSSISKYGEKGKNGVVLINSKKFSNNSQNINISWDEINKISENEKTEKNRLYIINGKEYLQSEIPKGTSVEVDGSISELTKEEGIKKYGQKGKDGLIIFEGKSTFVIEYDKLNKERTTINGGSWNDVERELNKENSKTSEKEEYKIVTSSSESNKTIKKIKEHKHVDYKKALIIYDGNEINYKDIDKINSNDIISSSVMKATKYALDKYGVKAKDGLIIINTQKHLEETDTEYRELLKKVKEQKAQEESKFSKEELEERRIKREQLIEERKKVLEEKKLLEKLNMKKEKKN
jgi:hypothetical protein